MHVGKDLSPMGTIFKPCYIHTDRDLNKQLLLKDLSAPPPSTFSSSDYVIDTFNNRSILLMLIRWPFDKNLDG